MLYSQYYIKRCDRKNVIPDLLFVDWVNKVEKKVRSIIDMKLLDLPDEDYTMNYDLGYSYNKMSKIIIKSYRSYIDFICKKIIL
jgi:hypothetical protein